MENFENNAPFENASEEPREEISAPQVSQGPLESQAPQEPACREEPAAPQPYSNAGAGRKESPFADAPYEMPHRPRQVVEPSPAEEPREEKPRGSGKIWKRLLAAVLIVVLVAAGCGITAALVSANAQREMDILEAEFDDKLAALEQQLDAASHQGNGGVNPVIMTGEGMTPSQIYAENVGSVVLIHSEVVTQSFGQTSSGYSTGSGFVVSQDGFVVTNYHVVEGGSAFSVIFHDGTEMEAKLVGSDSTNDLAVLKVEAQGLQTVAIGSSDELIVGDQVVAIGNPLGELTSTMTVGYVSAKDRDVTTDNKTINMLQTDAAINSGNSGGPLFNTKGEVIGITTAKYSGSSNSGVSIEGIGFAIPIDDVIGMIEDLMDHGFVTGAYLGVSVYSVDEETAKMYNFPMGSLVDSLVEGSCAQKAGVQPKDIITGIGGYEVESNTDLTRILRKFKAGDTSTIRVWRSGQYLDLPITFDERPQSDPNAAQVPVNPSGQGQMPESGSYEEWYEYFAPFFGDGNG